MIRSPVPVVNVKRLCSILLTIGSRLEKVKILALGNVAPLFECNLLLTNWIRREWRWFNPVDVSRRVSVVIGGAKEQRSSKLCYRCSDRVKRGWRGCERNVASLSLFYRLSHGKYPKDRDLNINCPVFLGAKLKKKQQHYWIINVQILTEKKEWYAKL